MVKRRTLGEGLTPEEEAFMNPSPTEGATKAEPAEREKADVEVSAKKVAAKTEIPQPPFQQPSVVFTVPAPLPGMVGLTTRIPAEISMALMAASMQRKIQRQTPFRHQDIVTEAITEWLRKNGFL